MWTNQSLILNEGLLQLRWHDFYDKFFGQVLLILLLTTPPLHAI
uniref:Uncharacterized protein n=1 Tax=Arundo donax TaxID=35708 RepID=A0A0A9SVY8_ARUDO